MCDEKITSAPRVQRLSEELFRFRLKTKRFRYGLASCSHVSYENSHRHPVFKNALQGGKISNLHFRVPVWTPENRSFRNTELS